MIETDRQSQVRTSALTTLTFIDTFVLIHLPTHTPTYTNLHTNTFIHLPVQRLTCAHTGSYIDYPTYFQEPYKNLHTHLLYRYYLPQTRTYKQTHLTLFDRKQNQFNTPFYKHTCVCTHPATNILPKNSIARPSGRVAI